MSEVSPFSCLLEIAERSQQLALELPAKENAQTHWNGLGFSLMGHRFVAPMGEIAELMRVPQATRLPGVKHFVVGIANVRGRLMPILDLATFFGAPSTLARAQRRIFAVEDEELYVGFIVDESLGMQHFPQDAFRSTANVDEMFQPFIKGCYRVGGNEWPILSLSELAADPQFEQLAQA